MVPIRSAPTPMIVPETEGSTDRRGLPRRRPGGATEVVIEDLYMINDDHKVITIPRPPRNLQNVVIHYKK